MNLDELRSVQSSERQAASLQNLRATFYEDAGAFIQKLQQERDRAAERSEDPFSSPEVRKLTDDIETARQTVEAIYERRVGKVVKMASIAAADMPSDEENLTNEERELFDTLVGHIRENRDHVLGNVLEGEGSDLSCARELRPPEEDPDGSPAPDAGEPPGGSPADPPAPPAEEPPGEGVDAAEMMGGEGDDGDEVEASATADEPVSSGDSTGGDAAAAGDPGPSADADQGAGAHDEATVERTTVRITADVGEILGADERAYDLSEEDVVTLPAANAGPLVEKGAAERLE